METTASLQIIAELKHLGQLRQFVQQTVKALGADPDTTFDMIMAVNEMATNIIIHGYQGQPGLIEVEVSRAGDSLMVYLRDQAPSFDPTAVPDPDLSQALEKRPLGKVGVYLTRRLVDEMIYHLRLHGGNELVLLKKGVL
jgi:anti-sigma regulatory factor (Ser/Thr protein kinase)